MEYHIIFYKIPQVTKSGNQGALGYFWTGGDGRTYGTGAGQTTPTAPQTETPTTETPTETPA